MLATRLYAALAKGDAAALDELLAPDFVGTTTDGLPLGLGGRYEGVAAMRDGFWWRIGQSYLAEAEPERFWRTEDGALVVTGRYRGAGRRIGVPLDAAFTHTMTFRDGRIATLAQLTDSAAWRQALGEVLSTVSLEVEDGVARVRLDRPVHRNAIDQQLADELFEVALRVRSDRAVRAVLISGAGPALTVGGDISYFASRDDLGALFAEMTVPYHEALRILATVDAPIVTAAHGVVAGGGLGLVYAADVTVAAAGTRFVTGFADLGVSGDGGGTWHLPRLVGPARARRIYLENQPFSAEEALAWGLVSEVVPADELLDQAARLASRLAAGPTRAFARMRTLFRASPTATLGDQLTAETHHLAATGRTADTQEGVAAFLAKRPPRFEGK